MKTIYVCVSDEEMREYDVDDDAVCFGLGGFCPASCKASRDSYRVYDLAIVTSINYLKREYQCSAGVTHRLPRKIAEFDGKRMRVGTPNSFGNIK